MAWGFGEWPPPLACPIPSHLLGLRLNKRHAVRSTGLSCWGPATTRRPAPTWREPQVLNDTGLSCWGPATARRPAPTGREPQLLNEAALCPALCSLGTWREHTQGRQLLALGPNSALSRRGTHCRKMVSTPCQTTRVCSVAQSCLTLCDPIECRPPGSSVHEILQARILEWVAISFSWQSS